MFAIPDPRKLIPVYLHCNFARACFLTKFLAMPPLGLTSHEISEKKIGFVTNFGLRIS